MVLLTVLLYHLCKYHAERRRQMTSLYHNENSSDLMEPLKGYWKHPETPEETLKLQYLTHQLSMIPLSYRLKTG